MNKEKLKENCCTPEGQIKRYIDCKGCDRKPKQEKDLAYWKENAEEDYMKVPISVLRYITELEERMYSEEEVIELLTARCKHFGTTMTPFRELLLKQDLDWFEQFKKK
jgi:hypothetical protein